MLWSSRFQIDGGGPSCYHDVASIRTLRLSRAIAGSSALPSAGYFLAAPGGFSTTVRRGMASVRKWLGRLSYYYDGRFSADAAFPFVAIYMAYRRRSAERCSWFLKSHVVDPRANAAEMKDKLRKCDRPFMERAIHFGGGVIRWADAFWAERPGDVKAWLHYRTAKGKWMPDAAHNRELRRVPLPRTPGSACGGVPVFT